MENFSLIDKEDEQMELPPGFRFHPTDEELITHYLSQKVLDSNFNAIAIGEADLNKVEPWDLPKKAKHGEKEWYFFCVRDRKYPTGLRTNRATVAGYWKATGKDKEIYKAKALVGMKKTLVFYTGRAPKGEKSNWVMHEYRLEGKYSKYNLPTAAKNEWVISRVFNKSSGPKKPDMPEFVNLHELQQPFLPPLMDSSPYNNETKPIINNNVTCFSDHHMVVEDQKPSSKTFTTQEDHAMMNFPPSFSQTSSKFSFEHPQIEHPEFQFSDSIFLPDESILKLLLEGRGSNITGSCSSKNELSQDTGLSCGDMNADMSPMSHCEVAQNSVGPIDLDCLWNY